MAGATRELPEFVPGELRGLVDFVVQWFPLVIIAVFWELISGWAVDERSLPGPSAVAMAAYDMLVHGDLLFELSLSLYRIAVGLGLSITIGVLLGIGMARSNSVEDFFDIFLAMLYPVPKTGLVPLALLWFGRNSQTAIFIIFLACLLPIILNTYNAATSVDQSLIWSAQMMGTSERRILWKVVIPDIIPQIATGIRQSIPFAFIALVGAEFIGAPDGIGSVIDQTGALGVFERTFAAILVISAMAFFALRIFDWAERRVITWR